MTNQESDKPNNFIDYKKWLDRASGGFDFNKGQRHFEAVADKICKDFQASPFWQQLVDHWLKDIDSEYRIERDNFPMMDSTAAPSVSTKSFDSFLLKTFRRNILENTNWPGPPDLPGQTQAWLLPTNWLAHINDVVRTCITVKYLDAAKFLINKLEEHCDTLKLKHRNYFAAVDDGYYAAHLYVRQTYEIPKVTFDTEQVSVEVEIQVTTQLQEVIRRLLHVHYERRRKLQPASRNEWQWDYKSNEFATNYLGHVLHYAEGMIMQVRDRQKELQQ